MESLKYLKLIGLNLYCELWLTIALSHIMKYLNLKGKRNLHFKQIDLTIKIGEQK